jgi:hypothetical protein
MVLKKIIALITFFYCSFLAAHPLDVGYMTINAKTEDGNIFTSMEIHPALVTTRNFFHETLGRSNWIAGNKKCRWRDSKAVTVNSEILRISARAECPGLTSKDRLSLDLRFLETSKPDVKIFIRAATPEYESTIVVNKFNHFIKMAPTIKAGFIEYTLLGTEALGISPGTWVEGSLFHIPFGLNQLLLILLMIAIAQDRKHLFELIGGFTISLSIALSFISLRGTSLDSRYIDLLMAFGLLYFSLDIALLRKGFRRIIFALLLGLIHGLKLGELLLGFNLPHALVPKALTGFLFGIVCAQLLVIFFVEPIFKFIKKYSFVRIPVPTATAMVVAFIGTLWLVEKSVVAFT